LDYLEPTSLPIVFDFHPIHVFLNTDHLETYESTREYHNMANTLIKYRGDSPSGSRKILSAVIDHAKLQQRESLRGSAGLNTFHDDLNF
jgi:hypothetical protein